jgi:N-succinyldiaminopimelate aminotransferase
MWDRTLTLSSGGKTFSFTGWKVGWAIGPAPLQNALRRVHQFSVFATTTPMQHAIADALYLSDSYYRQLASDYLSRRDFLLETLQDAGLSPRSPEGSYFVLSSFESFPFKDGTEFARFLIEEIGVAAIPLESFYLEPGHGTKWIRFCFCKRWDTLKEAADRLVKLRAYA